MASFILDKPVSVRLIHTYCMNAGAHTLVTIPCDLCLFKRQCACSQSLTKIKALAGIQKLTIDTGALWDNVLMGYNWSQISTRTESQASTHR